MVAVRNAVVLVTGGQRGLGAALVDEVLSRGARKVYVTTRKPKPDSRESVVSQALDYNHPPQEELALLCVHGLLHLLRWDHYEETERREMWRLTIAALHRSGVELPGRL